jgi:drug/metabolite transporter (DMT)-like permease
MTEPKRPRTGLRPLPLAEGAIPGNDGAGVIRQPAALALLCVLILVWGVNWPILKLALDYVPPLTFAVARLTLGGLCITAVLIARGRFRMPSRQDLPVVLSIGIFQLAAFLAFIHLGLMHVEAGRAAILAYTTLIWVTPLAVLFLGERLTLLKTIGLFCGLGGVFVLFNPVGFDWSSRSLLLGNGFLIAGALAWALCILHVRVHPFRLSPLQLTPWQMLVAIVPLAVLAFFWEADTRIVWSATLWGALAYNGALATGFALWAWVSINRALPAITTAIGSLGVPVVGLLASAVWLGETITATSGAGLLLISSGLALIMIDTVHDGGEAP